MCTNTFFLEKGAVMDQAMKAYLGDVPQFSYNSKKPKEAEVSLKRKAIRIILNIMIHTSNGRTTLVTPQIGIPQQRPIIKLYIAP